MNDVTQIDNRSSSILSGLAIVGAVVLALGLFVSPERIWPAWLVSVSIFVGLSLSGAVFIAIVRACSGKWADPLVPIARAMWETLPLGIVLSIFVVFGASSVYEWSHLDAATASHHMAHKLHWLNLGSFLFRTALCFVLWHFGTMWMLNKPGRGRAALWLVMFAVSFSIYSFDWLMSLEAEWFSTMFGVYIFCGLILTGVGALTLLALNEESKGRLKLSDDVRHDLGKLLFAFSFLWGYIWYCQYMLIWYTNMPEETSWYATRIAGSWSTMTLLSLAVNFVVPFLVLLPAPAKKSRTTLKRVALLLLVGRWIDLYVIVTPTSSPDMPPLGIWEIATPVGAFAVFFLWVGWRLDHKRREKLQTLANLDVVSAASV
ncbi:MAG: hypothetical protein ACI97A_004197 [Planctomycetota bacterium]|jgi:hypothetical protein